MVGVYLILILILHLIFEFILILHLIGKVIVLFFRLIIGVLLVTFALTGTIVILLGVCSPCSFLLFDLQLWDSKGLIAGDIGLELCIVLFFEVEADVDCDTSRHYFYRFGYGFCAIKMMQTDVNRDEILS